jgi:hypothetical protein
VLGTVVFGDFRLSVRRVVSRYHYLTAWQTPDPRNSDNLYYAKDNN